MRNAVMVFVAIVFILVALGLVMLGSASSDDFSFVWRQLIWLVLAFCAAFVVAYVDYHLYKKLLIPLVVGSLFLLILVLIPGIGKEINGSWRWLRIGPLTIQPSEISKITIIVLMAWWLARNQRRITELKRGIFIPMAMLGVFAVLLILEPDFGTTILVLAVAFGMMYLAGVSLVPLISMSFVGIVLVSIIIANFPERMGRILAFLDPQKYQQGKAWQLVNSFRAFAGGELWGVGLGNSMQKRDYLPEAHTDFIFAIIGEELGLVAVISTLLLYFSLFICGAIIATKARDDFGRLLAWGITLMITFQTIINIAVVSGCVPTKGLALPFISYGGSSLVVSGVMVGILLNVANQALNVETDEASQLFKDQIRHV